jgi:hypothetical protein
MRTTLRPTDKGDIAVAAMTLRFLQLRFVVLKPVSDGERYDLVIDRGKGFETVQVKHARMRGGIIEFNTCSSRWRHGGVDVAYLGHVDLFGVYCPDTGGHYLVPVADMARGKGVMRVGPPKIKRLKGAARNAGDYVI